MTAMLLCCMVLTALFVPCSPAKEERDAATPVVDEQGQSVNELILSARNLRELLWKDPHRPRYHLMPPEGFFNDVNGALFWKGRYHLFYLARTPITDLNKPGGGKWVAVWDHVSSRDLVHWIYHPPAIQPKNDGSTPKGIYSGGAIKNAPRPTLIYHVPGQGTCISVAQDDELIQWKELPQNPVIRTHEAGDEFRVFDPAGWYENGKYYALIGNKNKRGGYEGDCTSLFTSTNLVDWEYQGPFYKSDRKWTDRREDAACPDFYRMGNSDTWMLLMHCHGPYRNTTHYYLGEFKNERFYPERHGRMSWLGHQLSAPECLIDDKGRNIFFGWIAESRKGGKSLWGYKEKVIPGKNDRHAWASVVSLPRIMSLTGKGTLGIEPAPELEKLRYNLREKKNVDIPDDQEVTFDNMGGDVMELAVEIDPGKAMEIGVKVRCSPDGAEETLIVYNRKEKRLKIDFRKSTLDRNIFYSGLPVWQNLRGKPPVTQEAPFELADGETLKLRIFIDKSVLEVFANGRQCITQRIYPSRKDSNQVKLFAKSAAAKALVVKAWDMEQVMPW